MKINYDLSTLVIALPKIYSKSSAGITKRSALLFS